MDHETNDTDPARVNDTRLPPGLKAALCVAAIVIGAFVAYHFGAGVIAGIRESMP